MPATRLYVNKRLGCRAVANWLNGHGHRTREGRLWSLMTTRTVLRNQAYLGRVIFRDKVYSATHPPLIEASTFQAAQTLMDERGETTPSGAPTPATTCSAGF